MTRITIFLTILTIPLTHASMGQILSEEASISVITLGPDQQELYSAFGHSSFRVYDPTNGWDIIYNYGVFDFDQPNFYLNFANGNPYYKLGVGRHDRFRDRAIEDKRYVIEQTLNLTQQEKQKLFEFLQWNALPENANYFYNYIYDNCATKIRDVIDDVLDNKVRYDYSYVTEDLSFRDLMDLYMEEQPWGDLGIDICLGTGIDKIATGYYYMYLPDYVDQAFNKAVIEGDSISRPLVSARKVINPPTDLPSAASAFTPQMMFIAIFLVFGFISFKDYKRSRRSNWIDLILFTITGIVGWLLLFLWLLTDHISEKNFNLLWAFPLHFPMAFFLLKKSPKPFVGTYYLAITVILGILIVFWGFWPQDLHDSLIPFALLLLIRSLIIWNDVRTNQSKALQSGGIKRS